MDIKIVLGSSSINIYTPYNKVFVIKIKNIGSARWNSSNKCWTVPKEYIDNVRNIMVDVFGYSDIDRNETIDVKIKFLEDSFACKESIRVFGKDISSAYNRDSGARVGRDVVLISGKIKSGGSAKCWRSEVSAGSVFYLSKVNKNIFEKEKDDLPYKIEILEIREDMEEISELIAEKEKLLARITQINRVLGIEEKS